MPTPFPDNAADDPRQLRAEIERLTLALERERASHAEERHRRAVGNLQFAAAMVQTLDARDAYTAGHSAAVAVYTADVARQHGLLEPQIRRAHLAALLHDIGKIGVRDEVLNKAGKLTPEEYVEVQQHAAIGADVLKMIDAYADLAPIVRSHHERIDGKGYPDGLAGDEIPIASRIIAVADTYSAMTTDRPYREGMPPARAMALLAEAADAGQLDPAFTRTFLRKLQFGSEAYQRGRLDSFLVQAAQHDAMQQVQLFSEESEGRASRASMRTETTNLRVDNDIVLRLASVDDAEEIFGSIASNRSDLRTWMSWVDNEESVESVVVSIRRANNWSLNRSHEILSIFVKGRFAGEVQINELGGEEPMLGYWLLPQFRGRGIATRCVERVVEWAFAKRELKAIYADPYSQNDASLALPARLGFTFVRREERAECLHGVWHDIDIYRMTADEWYAARAPHSSQLAA